MIECGRVGAFAIIGTSFFDGAVGEDHVVVGDMVFFALELDAEPPLFVNLFEAGGVHSDFADFGGRVGAVDDDAGRVWIFRDSRSRGNSRIDLGWGRVGFAPKRDSGNTETANDSQQ